MNVQTEGTVISAEKQWWFKVNRKPVRRHSFDGAEFPYIIKVRYTVDGKEYVKYRGRCRIHKRKVDLGGKTRARNRHQPHSFLQ